MHKRVFCLMGPTASGKTQLALQLADNFPIDLISVDSVMVYRGLDIGSAKPSKAILEAYPHALVDICLPTETYSAGQFVHDAQRCIESTFSKGRIPLLVGGTMLYFHAMQTGLSILPAKDSAIRGVIQQEADTVGWLAMYDKLCDIDAAAAQKIHPHDPQRIMRALEVYTLTGQTLSDLQAQSMQILPYDWVNIILYPKDRVMLHKAIEKRFLTMLSLGLVEEVKRLLDTYPALRDKPAIRTVGYRQVLAYLEGKLSFAELQGKGVIATRQLAKRQCTWLKSWSEGHSYDPQLPGLMQAVVSDLGLSV